MVFKSDKQRKGFFGNKGNVRSQVIPVFFTTAFAKKDLSRKQLEMFAKRFSKDKNRKFVEVGQGKKGKIILATVKKSTKITPGLRLQITGDVIKKTLKK